MEKKRERGDNWSQEEKDLFLEIMRASAPIIENKNTNTNANKQKNLEWLRVQKRFSELGGKNRAVSQLKGAWKRLRMTSKKSKLSPRAAILESNKEIKERAMQLMEKEYLLKIEFQKRELSHQELRHKLEIELLTMDKERKALELTLLKE